MKLASCLRKVIGLPGWELSAIIARAFINDSSLAADPMDLKLSLQAISIFRPTLPPPWSIRPLMRDHCIHDNSYRWLRANNLLRGCTESEKFDPFWVVTKHAHIQAISRQNELFHNGRLPDHRGVAGVRGTRPQDQWRPNLVRSLVQMDAPDHPKYRALTQGWFMPANLGKFEAADLARLHATPWRA